MLRLVSYTTTSRRRWHKSRVSNNEDGWFRGPCVLVSTWNKLFTCESVSIIYLIFISQRCRNTIGSISKFAKPHSTTSYTQMETGQIECKELDAATDPARANKLLNSDLETDMMDVFDELPET